MSKKDYLAGKACAAEYIQRDDRATLLQCIEEARALGGYNDFDRGCEAVLHPGETVTCYACNQQVLKREVQAGDGFCPLCDAEISDEDSD